MDIQNEIKELQEAFQSLFEGRKEGESLEDYKSRLFDDKVSTIKAKRRNLDKQIKKDEKEYKETGKALEANKKESDEVSKKSKEASKKTSKAFNDYLQAQPGTELSNRMYKKYDNAGKKKDKLEAKSNELFDSRMSLYDKKENLRDNGNKKVEKRNNLNYTVARNTNYDNRFKVTDRPSFNKEMEKMMKKYKDNNSYNEIMDQIVTLKEAFDALFEVSDEKEEKQNVNKIKREKKAGPGKEPTEVVSVADELFPYEGSAKEQFNQKVIAKINDMIEGTATLEDLINLVRQKKVPVKESLNSVEEAIELMEAIINEYTEEDRKEAAKKVLPKRKAEFDKAYDDYEEVHSKIDPERILNYKLTPIEQYRANKTATKLEKAQNRLNHAQEIAGNVEKTPHGFKIKEALEEVISLVEAIVKKERPAILTAMDKDIEDFFKKSDEFIKKMKEYQKKNNEKPKN